MFFDLLVFFVPPVLGALANQSLRSGKTRAAAFWLTVVVACISYEILAFNMPFRASWMELIHVFLGTLAVMLVMILIPLEAPTQQAPSNRAGCAQALVILFLPIVSFTLVGRVNQAQEIAAQYEGKVSQKYHSHNHNMPSLTLIQVDGLKTTIEGVDLPAWDAVVEGESRLNKPAWSVFGELDGKRVRIVPHRHVMFLGPFPD
jgi:hypothetical protein